MLVQPTNFSCSAISQTEMITVILHDSVCYEIEGVRSIITSPLDLDKNVMLSSESPSTALWWVFTDPDLRETRPLVDHCDFGCINCYGWSFLYIFAQAYERLFRDSKHSPTFPLVTIRRIIYHLIYLDLDIQTIYEIVVHYWRITSKTRVRRPHLSSIPLVRKILLY